jgi:dephospho-CoA kinase
VKWIGLTGGIASGKSTVAELIRGEGIAVVDADQVAREVVEVGSAGLRRVVERFGAGVLKADGSLDRAKLGGLVFSSLEDREELENILHPLIRDRVAEKKAELAAAGVPLAFYDVPLLFEKKMRGQFDGVLVVSCGRDEQIARLMKRAGLSQDEAERRVASQVPLAEKVRQAEWVIDNSGQKDLHPQLLTILKKIKV